MNFFGFILSFGLLIFKFRLFFIKLSNYATPQFKNMIIEILNISKNLFIYFRDERKFNF